MWPNEQINGISFCGALMNGENHAIFFFINTGGRTRTHTQTVSLSATNDLYINKSRASVFPSHYAGQESMPCRSTTGEV